MKLTGAQQQAVTQLTAARDFYEKEEVRIKAETHARLAGAREKLKALAATCVQAGVSERAIHTAAGFKDYRSFRGFLGIPSTGALSDAISAGVGAFNTPPQVEIPTEPTMGVAVQLTAHNWEFTDSTGTTYPYTLYGGNHARNPKGEAEWDERVWDELREIQPRHVYMHDLLAGVAQSTPFTLDDDDDEEDD